MIMPTKHIRIENSLLGTGAELLNMMSQPKTISTLWDQSKSIKGIKSYESFTLVLDFMFIIGAIEFNDGFIRRIH
ncbi:MAG: hypothetical protein KKA64_02005 [Nanoarchaeota archaeon]|nr:hypothetical protein [Nanoarchaeota archaeon]